MDDFASTSLYNLIASQLQQMGFAANPSQRFEGKIERAQKAGLLSEALSSLGPTPIVKIGQGIRGVDSDATLQVLSAAMSPADLLERWQRLERYYHGKHRVRILIQTANSVSLEHYSRVSRTPSTGEDLVIAGLLAALLQRVGCSGLSLSVGKKPISFIDDDRFFAVQELPDETALWTFKWRVFKTLPALVPPRTVSTSLAEQVSSLIAQDLGRQWRLEAVAHALGRSSRTLQRSLKLEGTSFQRVLRTTRVEESGVLLSTGRLSLSETGYACGFSDQAHFSREFKLRFNLSPRQFAEIAAVE